MAVVPVEELAARRRAIREQMTAQRRIIERELTAPTPAEQLRDDSAYPRSHTMRFLVNHSGQLRKAISNGLTLMMMIKMFKTNAILRQVADVVRK